MQWILGIAAALVVAVLCFVAKELRDMRLLVTDTFARWSTHLFGVDGRGGLTADVRELKRLRRKPIYDDIQDHP